MKHYIFIIITLLLLWGCDKQTTGFHAALVDSSKNIEYTSLNLNRIRLDSINTSSFGESCITPDKQIAFIDKHFCTMSVFDTLGHYQQKHLGSGEGPYETQVGRIGAQTFLTDGRLVLFGYNLDFHVFNPQLTDKEIFVINRSSRSKVENSSTTYTNQYSDMVCRSYGNRVYFNVYSEHPDFNYLEHTDRYLNECLHIWEIDIDEQKDKRLLAQGYPDSYREAPSKYVIFAGCCFDIDAKGNFYVNYDTDSLIYTYDYDFTPVKTYGNKGCGMNTDYLSIYDYKECRKNYRSERNTKSYYYWIEYVDETGMLFRSYNKDSDTVDGLQIYRDGTLVADVEVPKKFRVMGYIAPYYYSYIIPLLDEKDDSLIMYKFKLD